MSNSAAIRRPLRRSLIAFAAMLLSVVSVAGVVSPAARADSPAQLTVSDAAVVKPVSGTANMVFRIRLLQPSHNDVVVHWYTSDGNAISGRDYAYANGSVDFKPGKTSVAVKVTVLSNTLSTGGRYFYLNLFNAAYATIVDSQASGSILDTSPQPSLTVNDTGAIVGYAGTGNLSFDVVLSEASVNTVTVRYSTQDGQARAGLQYTAERGILTFAPGVTSQTVTVPAIGGVPAEQRWYMYLNLGSPVNASILDGQATGRLIDNDRYGYLTVDDTTVTKPASGTKVVNVPVRLVSPATFPVTFDYYTSNDSAVAGTDYVGTTGTVTIPAGSTSTTVPVTVNGDAANNPPRGFYLNLTDLSGSAAILHNSYAYVTIESTPTPVTMLSVLDTAIVKGTSGTSTLTYTVQALPKSASPITFNYTTNDGNAIAGTDYTAKSGVGTIAANATSTTINVQVAGNTKITGDLGFYLDISANSDGTIRRSRGEGGILTADPSQQAPFVSVEYASGVKPTTGTANLLVPITLSQSSANTVTVNWGTFDNTAIQGVDYTSAGGTVTFAPGQTVQTVSIPMIGTKAPGPNKNVGVSISAPSNAVIDTSTTYPAILNRNTAPVITIQDAAVYRPLSGVAQMRFNVVLSAASVNNVTFNYGTSNGSAHSETATPDYVATSGSATIPAGSTTLELDVPVEPFTTSLGQLYFSMAISAIVNALPASTTAYGYILDDVTVPIVSAVGTTAVVGPSATTAVFPVTLSAPSGNTVTVNYATQDGSAIAGTDYTSTSGTVTFNPGQTAKTVSVPVTANAVRTGGSYFYLNLSAPVNARIYSHPYAVARLDYSALTPRVSLNDVAVTRQTSGSKNATFTVTLAPASAGTVTVNYATADGSALNGTDYTSASGTLTFNPGDTSKTVNVPIVASAASTPDRYFYLTLGSPVNATILRSQAVGDIVNTVPPTSGQSYLSVSDSVVAAPTSGSANESFTVSLQPASTSTVSISYYTSDNDAVAGRDYTAQQGTLTFAPGQTSKTVTVPVSAVPVAQTDRSFNLNLRLQSGPVTVRRGSSYGVILNTVVGANLNLGGDVSIVRGSEDPSPANTVLFTVNLGPAQTVPVTVDYHTEDNSAIAGRDYDATSGTLTFSPGQTSKTVPVTIHADPGAGGEYFSLVIDSPTNAGIPDSNRSYAYLDPADTFSITGKVTDPTGAPAAGIVVTRTGNNQPDLAVTTGADGTYTIPDSLQGKYTLTPTGPAGTKFLPTDLPANVTQASTVAQDLRDFVSYTGQVIRGHVGTPGGDPLTVTITRTGNSQPTATAPVNSRGYWAISTPVNGTYTVTPTAPGHTFTPASQGVTLTGTGSPILEFTEN